MILTFQPKVNPVVLHLGELFFNVVFYLKGDLLFEMEDQIYQDKPNNIEANVHTLIFGLGKLRNQLKSVLAVMNYIFQCVLYRLYVWGWVDLCEEQL